MNIVDKIKEQINGNAIVLYMKGNPTFPACGFSAKTVQNLQNCNEEFAYVDILQDAEIRQGIKDFSDWPTIPQVYVNGEFIGGCDIVNDMAQTGELAELISTTITRK